MSDPAVLLPKRFSHQEIILTKWQLGHSYTFDIEPIRKFWETPSIIENGHGFGWDEDHVTVFLKWTDFSQNAKNYKFNSRNYFIPV